LGKRVATAGKTQEKCEQMRVLLFGVQI